MFYIKGKVIQWSFFWYHFLWFYKCYSCWNIKKRKRRQFQKNVKIANLNAKNDKDSNPRRRHLRNNTKLAKKNDWTLNIDKLKKKERRCMVLASASSLKSSSQTMCLGPAPSRVSCTKVAAFDRLKRHCVEYWQQFSPISFYQSDQF